MALPMITISVIARLTPQLLSLAVRKMGNFPYFSYCKFPPFFVLQAPKAGEGYHVRTTIVFS